MVSQNRQLHRGRRRSRNTSSSAERFTNCYEANLATPRRKAFSLILINGLRTRVESKRELARLPRRLYEPTKRWFIGATLWRRTYIYRLSRLAGVVSRSPRRPPAISRFHEPNRLVLTFSDRDPPLERCCTSRHRQRRRLDRKLRQVSRSGRS